MIVTIVGSRDFPKLVLVRDFVVRLHAKHPTWTVLSGGADGVDRVAVNTAQRLGMATKVIEADWATYGRGAGMIRNTQLVLRATYIVAFLHGASPGTSNTIRQALDNGFVRGRDLFVYGPGELDALAASLTPDQEAAEGDDRLLDRNQW
jgi:YspA, cpYpsA-related SLOG family